MKRFQYTTFCFDAEPVEGRALDVFLPEKSAAASPALFFVHGGGWRGGSRAGNHALMRAFNHKGFICGATGYRLSGSNILDQLADVRLGYEIFRQQLRVLGVTGRVSVCGSSAGAHLAALLALAAPGECGESVAGLHDPWQPPAAACLQSLPTRFEPWDEMFPHIWTAMENIAGVPYKQNPELYRRVSPNRYLRPGACPVFLLEAENEHMFPLAHSRQFVADLTAVGVRAEIKVYPGVEHGFFYALTRREQVNAFNDIVAFLRGGKFQGNQSDTSDIKTIAKGPATP